MKMKELERRTGVSREAIRFYIREGLLPEPERPKKNVARYHDLHVTAIETIKRMQEEQSLPLDVIKTMLDADARSHRVNRQAFPALYDALSARLDGESGGECVSLRAAAQQLDMPLSNIKKLVRAGVIKTVEGDEGKRALTPRGLAILKRWSELERAGFNTDNGFGVAEAKLYAQFVDWLANQEMSYFYSNLSDRVSADEAIDAAEKGISLLNEILGLMRTDAILSSLAALEPPGVKK